MRKLVVVGRFLATWIPTAMLTYVFVAQGLAKFSDSSGWAVAFRHWGYPDWFRMTVGAIELAGGVLVLWRRSAPIGALLILCVMLGAMGTHALVDHKPREAFHEMIPTLFAIVVLIMRRKELGDLRAVFRRRSPATQG